MPDCGAKDGNDRNCPCKCFAVSALGDDTCAAECKRTNSKPGETNEVFLYVVIVNRNKHEEKSVNNSTDDSAYYCAENGFAD